MREIRDHARGDGWILTSTAPIDAWEKVHDGHIVPLTLYYTAEQRIEVHNVRNTKHSPLSRFANQYLDFGAKLGEYPGTSPKHDTEYSEQPRAIRMQRHAPDIYDALGHVRGVSEVICLRAAEEFGSTWAEKGEAEWFDRVKMVGEGRAERIAAVLD